MKIRYSRYRDRIDIDALERALGFEVMQRKGDEDRGRCILPLGLHKNGDRTGKMWINRRKKVYICWVCGSGSLLSLAAQCNNMDVDEATRWLYLFATEEQDGFDDEVEEILGRPVQEHDGALPYFNPRVLDRYEDAHHPWLDSKGISPDTRKGFHLKYAPEAQRKAPGEDVSPYVGEAIILPHFWAERLVGWQTRWLGDRPKWLPKYTNTNDFPRRETIFNYHRCLESLNPIVCESPTTVMFLDSQGITAMATFGANVSDEQLRLLRIFQQGIQVAPDNDPAGEQFAERLASLERFIPVKYVRPPSNKGGDLGDFALNPQALHDHLRTGHYLRG